MISNIADPHLLDRISAAILENASGDVFTVTLNLNGYHGGVDVEIQEDVGPDDFVEEKIQVFSVQ